MAVVFSEKDTNLWEQLKQRQLTSEVFVTPTDTIYGFGTAASNIAGIETIARLKERPSKVFILLVSSIEQAKTLVQISQTQEEILKRYWPGSITFVLRAHTGETLAVRLPDSAFINKFLQSVGEPVVSTSCNLQGQPPVNTIKQAVELFGDQVDFYIDGGESKEALPSTLVDLTTSEHKILREGAVSFN